jgi:hypothetical protein
MPDVPSGPSLDSTPPYANKKKEVPAETNTRAAIEERCFRCGPHRAVIKKTIGAIQFTPCGGGVEYLHRSPASRRRQRKGKFRIWDSKIWSRFPRDSDPRMTALARTSSNCKRQTRTMARERAPRQQTCKWLTVIKIWSYAPGGCCIPRQTGRLTVGRNIRLSQTQTSSVELYTGGCDKRTWMWWTEESPLLKLLIGNGWWRHCKLEKTWRVFICKVWKSEMTLWLLVFPSRVYKWSIIPFYNPNPRL